jgi:hypothetical protein
MGKAGGPRHSEAIARGLARAKRERMLTVDAHTSKCAVCGNLIIQPYIGPWREYCKNACRQKAYRQRKTEREN